MTDQHAVLLTARADLDLRTCPAARPEMLDAATGRDDPLVLDLTSVFVGTALVRDLVTLTERALAALPLARRPRRDQARLPAPGQPRR